MAEYRARTQLASEEEEDRVAGELLRGGLRAAEDYAEEMTRRYGRC